MIGIFSTSTHAPYNLATEEYLLHNFTEDVFFLYVNNPSIIVGKHQNTLAEINYQFINEQNIPVFRRLSGGGTVYHDKGNLNFCFIKSGKRQNLVNFEGTTKPIQEALIKLGVEAYFGKRHDLIVDGKKISGNASHVYKNRVMHHGTLLFDAQLDLLNNALKTNPKAFKDRAVKSVRSEVTNITNYLHSKMSFNEFCKHIYAGIIETKETFNSYQLSEQDDSKIKELVETKYNTWKWNYGYSPSYELKKKYVSNSKIRYISSINVEKGIITKVNLSCSDIRQFNTNSLIEKSLINTQHEKNAILERLNTIKSENLENSDYSELISLFI